MLNVTITVEESALAWAEIEAKRRNCSVSILLGQLLKEEMLNKVAEKQKFSYAMPTK
jgi:predicted transcriptional regulator